MKPNSSDKKLKLVKKIDKHKQTEICPLIYLDKVKFISSKIIEKN